MRVNLDTDTLGLFRFSKKENLSMDPNVVNLMTEQMHVHKRVYDQLIEIAGVRMSEVEKLLEALS